MYENEFKYVYFHLSFDCDFINTSIKVSLPPWSDIIKF